MTEIVNLNVPEGEQPMDADTDDIVTRLRASGEPVPMKSRMAMVEAADEIEQLRAELASWHSGARFGQMQAEIEKLRAGIRDAKIPHDWDPNTTYTSDPPQKKCRRCGAFSWTAPEYCETDR